METPTAALLIIGDEILSGKVDDVNGPFLIRALRERGVQAVELRIIGDEIETIIKSLTELKALATYVFTTGGIGPTHDDKTIEAVARAHGRAIMRHPGIVERLRQRYGDNLSDAQLRLADVPENAEVILRSTDAMAVLQIDGVYVLPGVPALARLCFEQVADRFSGAAFASRAIFVNVSESTIAARLQQVQSDHPSVSIGSYPRFGAEGYRVKITIDGRDADAVTAAASSLSRALEPDWLVNPETF